MEGDKDAQRELLESIVSGFAWRIASTGASAEEIAEEINSKFGDGRQITDVAFVAKCLTVEPNPGDRTLGSPHQITLHIVDMVEILRSDLTVANEGFNADSTDHGRGDVLVALVAVCDFIERFEEMKRYGLSNPLRALALALTQLDKPRIHPMLRPAKVRHRPPASQGQRALVSLSVAAMEHAQIEFGDRSLASQKVSNELHRRGYRLAGKPITAKTVANWRDRASEGPGGGYDEAHYQLKKVREAHAQGQSVQPGSWKRILDGMEQWDRVMGILKNP